MRLSPKRKATDPIKSSPEFSLWPSFLIITLPCGIFAHYSWRFSRIRGWTMKKKKRTRKDVIHLFVIALHCIAAAAVAAAAVADAVGWKVLLLLFSMHLCHFGSTTRRNCNCIDCSVLCRSWNDGGAFFLSSSLAGSIKVLECGGAEFHVVVVVVLFFYGGDRMGTYMNFFMLWFALREVGNLTSCSCWCCLKKRVVCVCVMWQKKEKGDEDEAEANPDVAIWSLNFVLRFGKLGGGEICKVHLVFSANFLMFFQEKRGKCFKQ